jgi:hypothetical protein
MARVRIQNLSHDLKDLLARAKDFAAKAIADVLEANTLYNQLSDKFKAEPPDENLDSYLEPNEIIYYASIEKAYRRTARQSPCLRHIQEHWGFTKENLEKHFDRHAAESTKFLEALRKLVEIATFSEVHLTLRNTVHDRINRKDNRPGVSKSSWSAIDVNDVIKQVKIKLQKNIESAWNLNPDDLEWHFGVSADGEAFLYALVKLVDVSPEIFPYSKLQETSQQRNSTAKRRRGVQEPWSVKDILDVIEILRVGGTTNKEGSQTLSEYQVNQNSASLENNVARPQSIFVSSARLHESSLRLCKC